MLSVNQWFSAFRRLCQKHALSFNRRRRVSINAPNSSASFPCALSLGQDSVGLSKSSTEEESMLCKWRVFQSREFQGLVNADACHCHDQVNRIKCMESRNSHKILQNDKVHTDLCQLLHRIVLLGGPKTWTPPLSISCYQHHCFDAQVLRLMGSSKESTCMALETYRNDVHQEELWPFGGMMLLCPSCLADWKMIQEVKVN